MSGKGTHAGAADGRSISRRRFVQAAGASGVVAGLAGCTGGGGDGGDGGDGDDGTEIEPTVPDEEVTIQWAADSRASDNSDEILQSFQDAGLPDTINVDILGGSQVTDDRRAKYQQWLSGGQEEPTLLMMDSGWTIPFIVRDELTNLSQSLPEEMTSQVKDNYFAASVATATDSAGDLFGIPLFPDFPTMQYRKDLVEDAGYDPEGENWAEESMSWEEFSQVVADVQENSGIEYGYTFQADVYEGLSCCNFNEFMTSWGGAYFGDPEANLFGPVGDRPITVDEEAVLDSIRMIRTFINGSDDEHALDGFAGSIAPQAVLQWTEETSRKPFTEGNAAFHRNWPYSIGINGADDAYGEDLGVMPIPYGVTADEAEYPMTGGPVAALGGWHMVINPNAPMEKKQVAAKVLEVMMTDEFRLAQFEIQGWIPPEPELLNSDRAAEVPVMGRYLPQLRVAGENAIPRPVTPVWPQQSGSIADEVNAAYAGDKSPEAAMSDLKEQLQSTEENA